MAMKHKLNDSDEILSNKHLMKDRQVSCLSLSLSDEYYIYWLDDLQKNPFEYYNIDRSKLRAIIDYIQIFQQFEQFEKIIRQNIKTKLFIILNFSSVEKMFPLLSDLEYIISIHVYRDNASMNQSIFDQYKAHTKVKVYGLFDNPNRVFDKLSKTIRIYSRQMISEENCNPLSTATEKLERTTDLHSEIETMNWFTYLYDVLEEIPPNNNGKTKFVEACRKRYQNVAHTLDIINEFNETYVPEKAIWWYSREGFLYHFVNRTLRQRDQKEMLLIHFFLYDLAQQLKIESDKNKNAEWMDEHIYRGQLMSIDEIRFIQGRKNQTLYVNTYLSTSTDLELVKMFAGAGCRDENDSKQSVIFDITGLGSGGPSEKSVADIHHLSFNSNECEILFSPGYTFTADNVTYKRDEKTWNINLDRIKDAYNPDIKFDQLLIKLDVLIQLILDSVSLSQSNEFYDENLHSTFENDLTILIKELDNYPSVNISLEHANEEDSIKEINERISPYELSSISRFNEYSLNKQYEITSLVRITLHDCLANIYKHNGKYNLAFEHFNRAIVLADENENIRMSFNRKINLAQTYKLAENYEAAWSLFEQLDEDDLTELFQYERLFRDIAMEISYNKNMTVTDRFMNCYNYLEYVYTKADLVDDGFTIGETYVELGKQFLYTCLSADYAILCFNRSLDIRHVSYSEDAFVPGYIYEFIGDAYTFKDKQRAVEYYEKALDLYSRFKNTNMYSIEL